MNRSYSLPCNYIGRDILSIIMDSEDIKIRKISLVANTIQLTVTKGSDIVEQILMSKEKELK